MAKAFHSGLPSYPELEAPTCPDGLLFVAEVPRAPAFHRDNTLMAVCGAECRGGHHYGGHLQGLYAIS